jgi:hypothetical protein
MKARLLCAAASAAVMASCVMSVGASAATVSVAPPEYYAEAGAFGGIWSDSPSSVDFNGPPYGAFAVSSPGAASAAFVAGGPGEPSTWAMMLIGFAGLGYAGFRRRSTARLA